jgi:Tol biopolymer transport system component
VPAWASHGFIVFKYLDSLAQMRPGDESGGILVGGPRCGTCKGPHTPWDPALSPNGRSLAFRGYHKPYAEGSYALYVLSLRHGTWRRITRSIASDPTWSPDGKWIAYDTSGGGEIWKVRATGGKAIRLTRRQPTAIGDETPAWSPDGHHIAFVRTIRGRGQIWEMRADGSGTHLVHADPHASDGQPAWSYDGTRLAFVARRDSHLRIEVMSANGRNAHPVTSRSRVAWNPVWLPHDTGIAFLSGPHADGNGNLFAMRANGRDVHQLTHWPARAQTPQFTWSSARILTGRA